MRCLLIDPSLFTWPYDIRLAHGLRRNGVEVSIVGPAMTEPEVDCAFYRGHYYGGIARRAGNGGPRIFQRIVKGLSHGADAHALAASVARAPVDVIHFQWLPLPLLDLLYLPAFARQAPLVLTLHDSTPLVGLSQVVGLRSALRWFSRIIVHTRDAVQRVIAMGADPSRIVMIPHGLLDERKPARPAKAGPVTLLMYGKIKPYKGLDVLIEALRRLPEDLRRNDHLRIEIVGKPYMNVAPLVAAVAAGGLERLVRFRFEFVSEEETDRLFRGADGVLMPYKAIDASGVLSLALAHGRPIIGSRVGGIAESFAEHEGAALCPPGDAAALAAAIERFCCDFAYRERLTQGVIAVRNGIPSWEAIGQRTSLLYSEILQSAPGLCLAAGGRRHRLTMRGEWAHREIF